MPRQAVKSLHVNNETFNRLFNDFKIKCTQNEMINSMLWFIEELGYAENDFATLILNYRQMVAEKQKEALIHV